MSRKWKYPSRVYINGVWIRNRIYGSWYNMIYRCSNSKSTYYGCYGARGITVCDEWLSYDNFYEWAMNNGYADNLTIDRIDVNGNYEPSNCRWVDIKTQNRNKRNNTKIGGKCITDISRELGGNSRLVRTRLDLGYSLTDAVSLSMEECKKLGEEKRSKSMSKILVEGYTLHEISVMSNLSYDTIFRRYKRGYRELKDLMKPVVKKQTIKVDGKTLSELAEDSGVNYSTLKARYYGGVKTIEELTRPVRGAK